MKYQLQNILTRIQFIENEFDGKIRKFELCKDGFDR